MDNTDVDDVDGKYKWNEKKLLCGHNGTDFYFARIIIITYFGCC